MRRYVIVEADTPEELETLVNDLMEKRPRGERDTWFGAYKPQGSAFQRQLGPEHFKVCQPMVFSGEFWPGGWDKYGMVIKK